MLPIFRIISVGGVTLAIAILTLALIPPGGTHLVLAQYEVAARGPLIDSGQHPEWKPFLIHAAFRRADELERLRRLPDTVVRAPDQPAPEPETIEAALPTPATPQVAGLSLIPDNDEPEDMTGSIGGNPGATIPIEIGEASSTELPVTAAEDTPPVIRVPALQVPLHDNTPTPAVRPAASGEAAKKPETRRMVQQRPRRKPAAPPAPEPLSVPPPFNILAAIFGSLANAESPRQPSPPTGRTAAAPPPFSRQAFSSRAVIQ